MKRVREVFTKDGAYGFGAPNVLTQKRRTADFTRSQGLVTAKTTSGVELDVRVLTPDSGLEPDVKEGPFGAWLYGDAKPVTSSPYPFRILKYLTLSAPPGADHLTVTQPRKPGSASIAARVDALHEDHVVVRLPHEVRNVD